MSQLIAVDKSDNFLGLKNKEKCHSGKGVLHRAFSIFINNNKNEILIQQRSKNKLLWPLYWSNSCCSHPSTNNILKEAEKRLKEEFGFCADLKFVYKFIYEASYKNIGSENEFCYVFIGKYNGTVKPNNKEILSYKWLGLNSVTKDVVNFPDKYTPWFKLELQELMKRKLI